MKAAKKRGQILILVLLIVVVALAIGLSVASRNIVNLRTSTQTEQSQRAFSAAEGGVEDVLSRISNIATAIGNPTGPEAVSSGCTNFTQGQSATCPVGVGDISANVEIKASGTYEQYVKLGDVAQIDLKNAYTNGVSTVYFEWGKLGTDEVDASNTSASVEITFVCEKVTCFTIPGPPGSSYSQQRFAYTTGGPGETGFTNCPGNTTTFKCRVPVPLPNDNVILARIRPFHKGTTVRVSGDPVALPIQTYNISSTAAVESGVTRKVEVVRNALPQLPAVFDYVLFSESSIEK